MNLKATLYKILPPVCIVVFTTFVYSLNINIFYTILINLLVVGIGITIYIRNPYWTKELTVLKLQTEIYQKSSELIKKISKEQEGKGVHLLQAFHSMEENINNILNVCQKANIKPIEEIYTVKNSIENIIRELEKTATA